jgi:hypothetical protein
MSFRPDIFESGKNIWDDGSIGNYWSDYDGRDDNGDGVGDSPYIIDENNRDKYPLIKKLEEEVKKYEGYLEKLEQLRKEGKASEKVYETLKKMHESKIEKLLEEEW